jgi:hypothetical protein
MKVLLVNNGGVGSSAFSMRESRFPIGLGFLSAMLKQGGHTTHLVDRFCDHDAWVDDPSEFDFVCVYTSTPCFTHSTSQTSPPPLSDVRTRAPTASAAWLEDRLAASEDPSAQWREICPGGGP